MMQCLVYGFKGGEGGERGGKGEGEAKEKVKCILFTVTFGLSAIGIGALDSSIAKAKRKRCHDFVKYQTSAVDEQ